VSVCSILRFRKPIPSSLLLSPFPHHTRNSTLFFFFFFVFFQQKKGGYFVSSLILALLSPAGPKGSSHAEGGGAGPGGWQLLPDRLLCLQNLLVNIADRSIPLRPEEGEADRLKGVLLRKIFGRPEAIRQGRGVLDPDGGLLLLEEHKHVAVQVRSPGRVRGNVFQHGCSGSNVRGLGVTGNVCAGRKERSEM